MKCRWADEKEYENFNDYRKNITSLLPKEAKIISFTKNFILIFEVSGAKIIFKIAKGYVTWGQFARKEG